MGVVLDYNIDWSNHLYLDESSPSGLRWARTSGNRALKGSVAGCKHKHSWDVKVNNIKYCAHRIIWSIINGNIPDDKVVDHLDGNPYNNALSNLELKTVKGNGQNKGMCNRNSSGITGVHYIEEQTIKTGARKLWVAQWNDVNGKRCGKRFNVAKYGYDQAKALAIAYRAEQIQLLNAAGASYTSRHTGLTSVEPPATTTTTP